MQLHIIVALAHEIITYVIQHSLRMCRNSNSKQTNKKKKKKLKSATKRCPENGVLRQHFTFFHWFTCSPSLLRRIPSQRYVHFSMCSIDNADMEFRCIQTVRCNSAYVPVCGFHVVVVFQTEAVTGKINKRDYWF